jgi:nitrate/TMAO reductase-like tetraheme cytochrome c subunit
LYKDYQQMVKEQHLVEKHPRFSAEGLKFAGSDACKSCHQYEYQQWRTTTHARAYATLEKVGSQFDPECVVCHVVGMEYESGFISDKQTPHLKDVGCENCHGPGSEHIKTLGKTKTAGPKSTCLDCHTPDKSTEYAGNEADYLQKIVHW